MPPTPAVNPPETEKPPDGGFPPDAAGGKSSPKATKPPDTVTPMMVQYLAIKEDCPDCLLFYRMGDFYELFFDDAAAAAGALDIALTKRGKHLGQDIPMCGVPVHSHEIYLNRLIKKGFKVAVCEQTEDPAEARKRGPKAIVRREIMRVITPGTLTEDTLLEARRHNYLAAVAETSGGLGMAWIDMSTGDFLTQAFGVGDFDAALARIAPGELLIAEGFLQNPAFFETFADWKDRLSPLPQSCFDSVNGEKRLQALFGVKTLDAFGDFSRPELAAAGALVDYVEMTQKGRLPRLAKPKRIAEGEVMEIDAATRGNLELTQSLSGSLKGSLLGVIDKTVTGAGARLLGSHLAAPLTDDVEIRRRLDGVAYMVDEGGLRGSLRDALRQTPDIERACSRLTVGRGGPRDLGALRDALTQGSILRGLLAGPGPAPPPEAVAALDKDLGSHDALIDRLARALKPDAPLMIRHGGFIAAGYAPDLDEQIALRDESRRLIAELQKRYREDTGVASLKVTHNNVLGFFVEVRPLHADKLGEPFIHRQTMANAVRFTTVELGELESKIARAADRALAIELALFDDLVGEVAARIDDIARAARALAGLDLVTALAELAVNREYRRPKVDDSLAFDITGGRHPVVEALAPAGEAGRFIPNDCDLGGDQRLWLVTGPNMAGKSTFLRQNALIAILAQMGSFVPATSAHLGVVDRLFSRVGAADDLARGRSTFMVEMVETAAILNQSGPRALVILDEIGRGTATYDGLSIAWAAVEHLHEVNRCRALFATHYHELTALAAKLKALSCHTMRVKEWRGDVVFLYEVGPGAADRSYGIHVARLAGLPESVVTRAEAVLGVLESDGQSGDLARLADDLPLFTATPARRPAQAGPSPLEEALAEVAPDELTPKTALELIYRLKALDDG